MMLNGKANSSRIVVEMKANSKENFVSSVIMNCQTFIKLDFNCPHESSSGLHRGSLCHIQWPNV